MSIIKIPVIFKPTIVKLAIPVFVMDHLVCNQLSLKRLSLININSNTIRTELKGYKLQYKKI